MILIEIVVVKF